MSDLLSLLRSRHFDPLPDGCQWVEEDDEADCAPASVLDATGPLERWHPSTPPETPAGVGTDGRIYFGGIDPFDGDFFALAVVVDEDALRAWIDVADAPAPAVVPRPCPIPPATLAPEPAPVVTAPEQPPDAGLTALATAGKEAAAANDLAAWYRCLEALRVAAAKAQAWQYVGRTDAYEERVRAALHRPTVQRSEGEDGGEVVYLVGCAPAPYVHPLPDDEWERNFVFGTGGTAGEYRRPRDARGYAAQAAAAMVVVLRANAEFVNELPYPVILRWPAEAQAAVESMMRPRGRRWRESPQMRAAREPCHT